MVETERVKLCKIKTQDFRNFEKLMKLMKLESKVKFEITAFYSASKGTFLNCLSAALMYSFQAGVE